MLSWRVAWQSQKSPCLPLTHARPPTCCSRLSVYPLAASVLMQGCRLRLPTPVPFPLHGPGSSSSSISSASSRSSPSVHACRSTRLALQHTSPHHTSPQHTSPQHTPLLMVCRSIPWALLCRAHDWCSGTDYFGQFVYGGDPAAPRHSDAQAKYAEGVKAGNLALALQTSVSVLFNCAVPCLIDMVVLNPCTAVSLILVVAGWD